MCLGALVNRSPGNWRTMFQPLAGQLRQSDPRSRSMLSNLIALLRRLFGLSAPAGGPLPAGVQPAFEERFTKYALGVGGIESISIDGTPYYFGYSYAGDMVLTELFDDAEAMAAFASQNMLQKDGIHDVAYWRMLVQEGAEESNLSSDEADLDITTEGLQRIAADLLAVEGSDQPVPGFELRLFLIDLLASARADQTSPRTRDSA